MSDAEKQQPNQEVARSGQEQGSRTKLVLHLPPRRGLIRKVLIGLGLFALVGALATVIAGVIIYEKYSEGLPELPSAKDYRPPVLSEFWTSDGVLAGEFYAERRKVVPYERIPKKLVQAFIAAEDNRFFDHMGFDPIGMARAGYVTYVKRTRVQGGSTLTQQAAKAVLVSVELSKITEEQVRGEAKRRLAGKPLPPDSALVQQEESGIRDEISRQYADWEAAVKEAKAQAKAKKEKPILPPEPAKVDDAAIHAMALDRLAGKTLADDPDAMRAEMYKVSAKLRSEAHARATEKTLRRKIRELILALRLEQALTKEEILFLYLNNVYLGHHSYGVQSAAENYFRKDVRDLTLGEMTLLAGLPQAPSKYSPAARPEAAKKRREYVLSRMVADGMISEAEKKVAEAEDPVIHPVEDVFKEFAPFFTEQVRRDVVGRYGIERLLKDGLRVHTTMHSERQRAAQVAMLDGLIRVDKRQGFPGPLLHLATKEETAEFEKKIAQKLGEEKLTIGEYYVGHVERVDLQGNFAEVNVGGQKGILPILGMRWAREPNPERYYPSSLIEHVKQALKPGDVIVVRGADREKLAEDAEARFVKLLPEDGFFFRLEQEPTLQGAVVSVDPARRYVVAMIGGYDFDASEFNRAYQACRQPGSSFKPVIYSGAIELLGWQVNRVLVDSPVVFDDPDTQLRWKPENFGEDFKGDVLLRTALVNSMNIPAVKTLHAVGVKEAKAWARRLGITTPINEDLSMALGGSCVQLQELVNVYATMNQGGRRFSPVFIRRVEDRFGRTLEDHTAIDDEFASFEQRVAAGYAKAFERPEQVMKPSTAFLITHLMRQVVLYGTGAPAKALGKPAAGKTGTTNDSFDTWFMGFTQDLVTGVWLGYDRYDHPLGKYETGGRASLPIWVDFMKRALGERPQGEFDPRAPDDIVWARIDPETGNLAGPGTKGAINAPFVRGEEPTERELGPGTIDPTQFMLHDDR